MNRFRKVIFWCHLPIGVVAGIIILIMSITGVLLAYERQITAWADTRSYEPVPRATAEARVSVETLLSRIRETQSALPSTLTIRSDPAAPAAMGFSGGRTVFVDAHTGDVLGEGSPRVRSFFRSVTEWHRWLGFGSDNRAIARSITGACNLGFLFLVSSGFYLWWPRGLTWARMKSVLWFKRGLPGKARDFNWHNVIGFWSAIPLFVVVFSGVVISYPWASNMVYRVVGESPPAPRASQAPPGAPQATGTERRAEGERSEGRAGGERAGERRSEGAAVNPSRDAGPLADMSLDGLEQAWARAEQQVAGWQSISLRLPNSADAPVAFTIDRGNGGQPQDRAQLVLARKSSEVVQWEPFSDFTRGRKLRTLLRFAHTGEVVGIAGQTLAGIAAAGSVVLVWTGLALAFRRFRGWLARRSQAAIPIEAREVQSAKR